MHVLRDTVRKLTSWLTSPTGGFLRDVNHTRAILALVIITVAAGGARFASLGQQSFWDDELFTVWLTRMDLRSMISTIASSEATPPLYYVLAWGWTQLFGSGEIALRALSALAGTSAVPLSYVAVVHLSTKKVALALSALVALNPFLVWYGQEARAYALLVPLSALLLWAFLKTVDDPNGLGLPFWAIASAIALTTHYFAVFLIVPTGAWLLFRARSSRRWTTVAAMGVPAVTGLALTPLLLHQTAAVADPGGLEGVSLLLRVATVPKNFLVGYALPAELFFSGATAVLVLIAAWLALRRAKGNERQLLCVTAVIAVASAVLPALLALAGQNYMASRNVIMSLIPLLTVVAIGFLQSRGGLITGSLLILLWSCVILSVSMDPRYQRKDWRGAAEALGPVTTSRALVFSPYFTNTGPFRVYFSSGEILPPGGAKVQEIAVVALPSVGRFTAGVPRPPRGPARPPPPGFRLVERREATTFTLVRYEADEPITVSSRELRALEIAPEAAAFVWQPGPLSASRAPEEWGAKSRDDG